MSQLNRVTYLYIAPAIIFFGLLGDVLTIATLTHPLLRRAGIIYTYLTLLAMTDLFTQLSVIPMILWLLDMRLCSSTAAFYYAHIGFPLANALMGRCISSGWVLMGLLLLLPSSRLVFFRRECLVGSVPHAESVHGGMPPVPPGRSAEKADVLLAVRRRLPPLWRHPCALGT